MVKSRYTFRTFPIIVLLNCLICILSLYVFVTVVAYVIVSETLLWILGEDERGLSLAGLIRRMSKIADDRTFPRQTARIVCIKFLAALTSRLGSEDIRPFLSIILRPLYRISEGSSPTPPEVSRIFAKESILRFIREKSLFTILKLRKGCFWPEEDTLLNVFACLVYTKDFSKLSNLITNTELKVWFILYCKQSRLLLNGETLFDLICVGFGIWFTWIMWLKVQLWQGPEKQYQSECRDSQYFWAEMQGFYMPNNLSL